MASPRRGAKVEETKTVEKAEAKVIVRRTGLQRAMILVDRLEDMKAKEGLERVGIVESRRVGFASFCEF